MFKRYSPNFDSDGKMALMDNPRGEVPPRIFDGDQSHASEYSLDESAIAPEAVLGSNVQVEGTLQFTGALRIDGQFEGELEGDGILTVGKTGQVKSHIEIQDAIIEGTVEGNISVSGRVELRGEAKVTGDISAKAITVDEGVSIVGRVSVRPPETKQ